MNTLRFLSPGRFLVEDTVQVVLKSYASFYHQVTPKHQRSLSLCIIEEHENFKQIKEEISKLSIGSSVELIDRSAVEKVQEAYLNSDFFFYPDTQNQYKIIMEALRFNLPVLTLKTDESKELLDSTCGMLADFGDEYALIEQFSEQIEMLFFDREACKYMKKGARKQSRSVFGKKRAIT